MSDVKGGAASKKAAKARLANDEMVTETSERAANIEVGDFVSELASAIRYRELLGLREGDYLEEPERAYTDGMAFGREISVASGVKLQISLTLDASTSMWVDGPMAIAGAAFVAIDACIRKALQDLPEGAVVYDKFIFHETAHRLPTAFISSYGHITKNITRYKNSQKQWVTYEGVCWPTRATLAQREQAVVDGEFADTLDAAMLPLSGSKTLIAPLFQVLADWEKEHGDPDGVRVDIVITDGVLTSKSDVEYATQIQEGRNGRLKTVLLNFAAPDKWGELHLPDRCQQYAVNADNLTTSLRDILSEAVSDML